MRRTLALSYFLFLSLLFAVSSNLLKPPQVPNIKQIPQPEKPLSVQMPSLLENELSPNRIPVSEIKLSSPTKITVVKSDYTEFTFRYDFTEDALTQQSFAIDNQTYTVFKIEGTTRKELPGTFDLPSQDILIGIPQQGDIVITTTVISAVTINNIDIPPVPMRFWDKEPIYKLNSSYAKSSIYPENICEVSEIGYLRDIRIARIKITPIQYQYPNKRAIINYSFVVHLRFSEPAQYNPWSDYFDGICQELLLNGKDAVHWKKTPQLNPLNPRYPQGFLNWYKIKVESTGVYKITYEELRKAGLPIKLIDPRTIRLFNIGECTSNVYYPDTMVEIPIYISGESDGSFDKDDYILFYGLSPSRFNLKRTNFYTNPFTRYNYYWLTWGFSLQISGYGKRMEQIQSTAQSNPKNSASNYAHLEQDRDCPARSGLLWIWELFSKEAGINAKTFDITLNLQNPESLFSISGRFWGKSSSNYLKVGINNTHLDTFYFSGGESGPPPFDFVINRRIPLVPNNTINFTLYNTSSQEVFFDYLDVHYSQRLEFLPTMRDLYFYSAPGTQSFAITRMNNKPLVWDITNYYAPKMITGYYKNQDTIIFGLTNYDTTFYYITDETKARKVLSIESRIVGRTLNYGNIHYFIIAPDELYPNALLLENYRRNNIVGIPQAQVKTVPLSAIYDDFTFGIEEPGAIKRLFQKYRPYFGLLLGDGTYDYRNILQLTTFPTVPPYERGYDIDFQVYSFGALSVDAWYADFNGPGTTPDMILGRITARNNTEIRNFYDKLIDYESRRTLGFWNKRFILLSDDEWKGQGTVDVGFWFEHISNNENLEFFLTYNTNQLFHHLEPIKIYLTEYPFNEVREKRLAREALLKEINRGVSLLAYFGHGSGFQIAHEQVFKTEHIPLIKNGKRNLIAFFGSCGVGRFDDTKFESITEELVRRQEGAIATTGASKATFSADNFVFAKMFFQKLIAQPESTLGRAFLLACYTTPQNHYYHLFGDPATIPALPNLMTKINAQPDTFQPAKAIQCQAPNSGELYSTSVFSNRWQRRYESEIGTIFYALSGYEIFRGIGRTINDTMQFRFVVPLGLPRFIRYDILPGAGGGYYTEIPHTSRISAISYDPNQNKICSFLKDTIVFDTAVANYTDFTGPKIELYYDEKRINNNDIVPKQFTLTGIVADTSGILLAPIPGNYYPRLIIRKSNQIIYDVDLTPYFNYDIGNFTQGRFFYPVDLDTGACTILCRASDNLLRVTQESVKVQVLTEQRLNIHKVLYYLDANTQTGYFTFELTQPAWVQIKIYTIAGRLINTLPERYCSFGYNQIEWNGKDADGDIPANGVYLYKIIARSYESGKEEKKSIVEKFIIMN
ncbi:MAG: C25 family cysteine peptidase [candidate division WOR-3 bacterium]|nr:C25 family cysteine peptidase [candidate division WOR-3 bacterium]